MSSLLPTEHAAAATPVSQSRAILHDLFIVAAVGACIWVTHRLGRIVVVLMLAIFFAYVIAPLVEMARHPVSLRGWTRRLPRGAAIAVVYLLLAGGAGIGSALLWPSAAQQLDAAIVSVRIGRGRGSLATHRARGDTAR